MIEKRFRDLWEQLQGKKPHLPHFLAEIHLEGIRGIDDIRVVFDYPVSVIAGGNASGKSTVLFAAACAYKVPGAGVKDFVPSTLFPDYRPKLGRREDEKREIVIEFDYSTPGGPCGGAVPRVGIAASSVARTPASRNGRSISGHSAISAIQPRFAVCSVCLAWVPRRWNLP